MGGGVSLPTVPLSSTAQDTLKSKYAALSGEGKDDGAISQSLADSLPGIIIFDQIDCDHTGSVSKKELQRLLKSLPRKKPVPPEGGWPGGEPPKFVPIEGIIAALDGDGDGEVSLDEWLENIAKLPGLKAAIDGAVDPSTGKIASYQSLKARLDELVQKAAPLEAAFSGNEASGEPSEELQKLRKQIAKLRDTVGSAGVAVFRQFDSDGSGKIDRSELLAALKALPKPKAVPGAKRMSMDEIIAALDVDGDGVIDVDEWVAQLDRLPSLKASIEQAIDPATGKVKSEVDGAADVSAADTAETGEAVAVPPAEAAGEVEPTLAAEVALEATAANAVLEPTPAAVAGRRFTRYNRETETQRVGGRGASRSRGGRGRKVKMSKYVPNQNRSGVKVGE